MMASRSFCTISPCIEDTVKFAARIFSVSQSTCKTVNEDHRHGIFYTDLSPCVAENNRLSDCQCVVEVTQGVKLPILLFDRNEELLDALESQLVTFNKNPNGVRHELRRHLQNIVRKRSAQNDNLSCGRKVSVDVVDLVFESLVEKLIRFVKDQHFDISCAQASPPNHVEDATWRARNDVLPVLQLSNVLADRCTAMHA